MVAEPVTVQGSSETKIFPLPKIHFELDTQLEVFGYDPIGLNENNVEAEGLIDSELVQGDYLACHTFGWAEFEIVAGSRELVVTVYGMDAYSEVDLLTDPNNVLTQIPRVVSEFVVHPN